MKRYLAPIGVALLAGAGVLIAGALACLGAAGALGGVHTVRVLYRRRLAAKSGGGSSATR